MFCSLQPWQLWWLIHITLVLLTWISLVQDFSQRCRVLKMKIFLSCTKASKHYDDVTMTMLASQITSLTVVYSIVYSGVNQRKHQSSASLAFVWEIHRGPVNFPHKWPVTRKMFPFDDVIMSCIICLIMARLLTYLKPSTGFLELPLCFHQYFLCMISDLTE